MKLLENNGKAACQWVFNLTFKVSELPGIFLQYNRSLKKIITINNNASFSPITNEFEDLISNEQFENN